MREAAPGRRWLVACSGGADSLVLAEVVRRWRPKLCDRLVIAHVHHGPGPAHRDQAQELVRRWARAHRLPFVTNRPVTTDVADEAGLRRFRYTHLERWRRRYRADVVVLGHHRDDLIETRLLRLLRGTGPRGLTAMTTRSGPRLRPLLETSRAEVRAYARGRGLVWCEDPSNADPRAGLRAWLRHEWLPALESRSPGAGGALARSLSLIDAARPTGSAEPRTPHAIFREEYAARTIAARETVVSDYLSALDARDFGRTHVREVVKRLDTRRKEFSFTLLGFNFLVTSQFWWASRVCEKPTPC